MKLSESKSLSWKGQRTHKAWPPRLEVNSFWGLVAVLFAAQRLFIPV